MCLIFQKFEKIVPLSEKTKRSDSQKVIFALFLFKSFNYPNYSPSPYFSIYASTASYSPRFKGIIRIFFSKKRI